MKPIDPNDLQLIDITQTAKLMSLSRCQVQRLVSEKQIPVIDLNKGRSGHWQSCLRIRLKDLQAFIDQRVRNKED